LADRLLQTLGSSDEDGDDRTAQRVKELVLEAAAALRASRDWPLLEAALREREAGAKDAAASNKRLLLAAGLGSLGQYTARLRELGTQISPSDRRRACPRAGMRLFQLALAVLLLERERQRAASSPGGDCLMTSIACDPEYDSLDLALLRSLGFGAALRATAGEALRSAAPAAAVLCYLPLCPRDAYDEVLSGGAYWSAENLPNLQILGTSFGAQGESAALVAAIAAFGGGGGGGLGVEAPEPPSEKQALLASAAEGVLVEIPAPDFACHGVGIALHGFEGGEALAAFFAGAAAAGGGERRV
jgi:hypothetical protein